MELGGGWDWRLASIVGRHGVGCGERCWVLAARRGKARPAAIESRQHPWPSLLWPSRLLWTPPPLLFSAGRFDGGHLGSLGERGGLAGQKGSSGQKFSEGLDPPAQEPLPRLEETPSSCGKTHPDPGLPPAPRKPVGVVPLQASSLVLGLPVSALLPGPQGGATSQLEGLRNTCPNPFYTWGS